LTYNSKFRIKNYISIISIFIILISFKSSNQWSTLPIGNELFWWIIQTIFIYILFKIKNLFSNPFSETNLIYINIYLIWNVICIARGAFIAENYWEWKSLIAHGFLLLLPLIVYLPNSFESVSIIVKTWFQYGLILFILFTPFLWGDAIGKFLIPISFLLLFFPVLSTKWKFVVIIFSLYAITFDITARSNVIKFIVPFLISSMYYIKSIINNKILNLFRLFLLFIPFVLLVAGLSGVFNIFKLDEYLGERKTKTISVTGVKGEENLTADTRTFLYIEVIESAIKHNYILLGRTPARGNDSKYFGDFSLETLKTGKQERFANEVSILNIFTWLGIVGVILYFLIFFKSSYLAINDSNNIFIKFIGLNVSFRWAYGFVEDFSNFDLSNIFLWLMIGMCFSKKFRKMSNNQMKNWVLSIFDKPKYSRLLLKPNNL
jgi:hypothetical protein